MNTKTRLLMMFLTFGVLFGAVNKGFSQATDPTTNGNSRYQPSFPYKVYPNFYTPTQVVELRNNPAGLKTIGAFITDKQLDSIILAAINHCVALDGFTWNGGQVPVFKDASILDSMVRNNMYELRTEKFPNKRYKVSAIDTKLRKIVWGDGANEGMSQVLYLDPNQIPGADNPGSYHLWPNGRLTCENGLLVDQLTEFPTKKFTPPTTVPEQATASAGTTVPGKIIIIEGDTIIVEGDVIYKEAATSYQQPSGYRYESDYGYHPDYYGGGYSSGCGFGIYASLSFGYGYSGYSGSCGPYFYGPHGYNTGSYYGGSCGGNYGSGYYGGGDNYYNYNYVDNSINNSFNNYFPFTEFPETDFPSQQGGGYADNWNDDDNVGGGVGGDVPGQQGGSDDNGKVASSGKNTTAINWGKTSGIKTTEANTLPSFADNKTGVFKNTGDVSNRAGAQSTGKTSTVVTSREVTKQENKPAEEVVYRGREGAIMAEEARSNANNQSRHTASNQESRGRTGAEASAARSNDGGNSTAYAREDATSRYRPDQLSTKVDERSGTTTHASHQNRNTQVDRGPKGTRTDANVQASRTPTSSKSSSNVSSQKRQPAPQGKSNVSSRPSAKSSTSASSNPNNRSNGGNGQRQSR